MTIKSIRGFNDLLPAAIYTTQYVENIIESFLNKRGFDEIRTPIVEYTELFKRSIGDETDIVSKEMYSFEGSGERSFTLRPEGTVAVARAILEANQTENKQKLWYNGYMFRAENPQQGRYRQFQQVGIEIYNLPDPRTDIELLFLCSSLFKALGLDDQLTLEINSLGSRESRERYRNALVGYFECYRDQLDKDSLVRLERNPLRILDSKNPDLATLIEGAPKLCDFLDSESRERFESIKKGLNSLGVKFVENSKLVRGLDYYNDLVFEFTMKVEGAQNTLCAGGRYDGLMSQLDSSLSVSAIGCAIGIERLVLLLNKLERQPEKKTIDVFICTMSEECYLSALALRDRLLEEADNLTVMICTEKLSLKNQLKRADRSGARIALILGDNELKDNTVGVKYLREEKAQVVVSQDKLSQIITTS